MGRGKLATALLWEASGIPRALSAGTRSSAALHLTTHHQGSFVCSGVPEAPLQSALTGVFRVTFKLGLVISEPEAG